MPGSQRTTLEVVGQTTALRRLMPMMLAPTPGPPTTKALRSSGLNSGMRARSETTFHTSSGLAFICTVAEIGVGRSYVYSLRSVHA